jgi:hypothetical protein
LSAQARQYGATITHGRVSDLMLGGDGFCGILEGRQVSRAAYW